MTTTSLKKSNLDAQELRTRKRIGDVFRYLRAELGYTRKKLAGRLRVTENTLYHWEYGHNIPTGYNLLGVNVIVDYVKDPDKQQAYRKAIKLITQYSNEINSAKRREANGKLIAEQAKLIQKTRKDNIQPPPRPKKPVVTEWEDETFREFLKRELTLGDSETFKAYLKREANVHGD